MFGGDGLTSGCIHNRLMQEWMNPFRKQNPLVLCQILENQAFFVSSGVVLWKCSVERSRSKWHSRDLGILRGRRHQGEVHFAYKDTMDRLHCKLSL